MKEKTRKLKIFNFTSPIMNTELLALGGDKYSKALPFEWEYTTDYQTADLVIWDGVVTPKLRDLAAKMVDDFKSSKFLLLVEGTRNLSKNKESFVIDINGLNCALVSGWSALPEDLLLALEKFWQKLNYV